MQSFDFYDTLATRLVALPTDVFELVGERMGIADFRQTRINAELAARRRHGGEVTLDDIYAELPLPQPQKDEAKRIELELEVALLRPIRAVVERFNHGDIVITDMYHSAEFYARALENILPDTQHGGVLISAELRKSKAGGDIWPHVREQFPHHREHTGDNMHADVKQARRNGFNARYYAGTVMTRAEQDLGKAGLDGSLLAGVARATRTELTAEGADKGEAAIIEAFAGIFAPLFYGFFESIWDRCVAEGIGTVYFLARDGYVIKQMFDRLNAARGGPFRTAYVYGSRHALHSPGYQSIDQAENWLLDNTPVLSLADVAYRAGVPMAVIAEAAQGILDVAPEANLTGEQRGLLPRVIRHPAFIAAIEQASQVAFEQAWAYYQSTGLTDTAPAALVDIGWVGRMQASLRGILSKGGGGPDRMLGFYLCLTRSPQQDARDELVGYLTDPTHNTTMLRFFDGYRWTLEAACAADHPTTLGFAQDGDGVGPVLGAPDNEANLERIRLQHRVVECFADNMIRLEQVAGRRVSAPLAAISENLRRYLEEPTPLEAQAFHGFLMASGQGDAQSISIVERVTLATALRRWRRPRGWPEGSMAVSGLGWLCKIKKAVQRAKRYFRQVP